jgi:hypothetical protein
VGSFAGQGQRVRPRPVAHTSHPTFGYDIRVDGWRVAWALEFWEFPTWAAGADVVFADGAGWERPIRFAGGVGGHLGVVQVAEAARRLGVRRVVYAHLGRPTIRALDRGERPPFGEVAHDRQAFRLARHRGVPRDRGVR